MYSSITSYCNRSLCSTHLTNTSKLSHTALRSLYHSSNRRSFTARSVLIVADMFASLKSILSKDEKSSSIPGSGASPSRTPLFFSNTALSWEELQAMVDKKHKDLGVEIQNLETGPPSPAALRRTFGQPGEPRVKLYRDHAAWCPYCHKVVLQVRSQLCKEAFSCIFGK